VQEHQLMRLQTSHGGQSSRSNSRLTCHWRSNSNNSSTVCGMCMLQLLIAQQHKQTNKLRQEKQQKQQQKQRAPGSWISPCSWMACG
jgi:hypothetical protein